MALIDIDGLLEPVSSDEEAGPDLEYDAEYAELFRIAEGTPERRMGDTTVPAQEPDWREVRQRAIALLGRSKDLRLAVLLTRAALMVDGMAGAAAGLALTHRLLDRYWDGVHPRLDPDDGDPTERVNSLLPLADREAFLDPLRKTTLAESRVLGPVDFRGVEIARGHFAPVGDEASPDTTTVSAIFRDCDADALAATAAAVTDAAARVDALVGLLSSRLSTDQVPDLSGLKGLLGAIQAWLDEMLADRGLSGAAAGPDEVENPPEAPAATPARPASAQVGEIRSREDVVRALQQICDYYSRNEPSSPVPLLLRRAQRLATGSFIEIVRDLAPDALKSIEQICGAEESA
jgi:type VI secretion system protein ImpA